MASVSFVLVGRRRHDQLGEAGEGDDADAGAGHLVLDEGAGRLLGHGQAVGLDVGGAHRARHVEGQDDRRAPERHVDRDLRPGRRDAPAPARLARNSATGTWRRQRDRLGSAARIEGDAREAHRLLALAPQLPQVGAEQQRHEQEQEQGERRRERHRYTNLPNHSSDRAAPTTSSSDADAGHGRRHLGRLGLGRELQVDVVVDLGERRGVVGVEVRAVGARRRSRCSRSSSSAVATLKPSISTTVPCGAADADRVDVHARHRRQLGHVERVGLGGVLAVGQQDDGGRAVVADVEVVEVGRRQRRRVDGDRLAGDGVERR